LKRTDLASHGCTGFESLPANIVAVCALVRQRQANTSIDEKATDLRIDLDRRSRPKVIAGANCPVWPEAFSLRPVQPLRDILLDGMIAACTSLDAHARSSLRSNYTRNESTCAPSIEVVVIIDASEQRRQ
jgi:hypothetical protein